MPCQGTSEKRRAPSRRPPEEAPFARTLGKTLFPSNLDRGEGNMLRIGSGSFGPETLVILETAFDEAWITLKTNGSGNIRPNELARRICHLAMEGERDPVRLHDRALGELIPATMWRELS